MAAALDAGPLKVRVGTLCPLAAATDTLEMLEGRRAHAPGKIVLLVREAD